MFWRRGREHRTTNGDSGLSDQDLLRAVIGEGNDDAMAQLYRRHGGLVYRFSLRLVQNESIAEEVTQDVFLALLGHADRFDPERGSMATWLCGIARRLVWKQLRLRQRDSPLEEEKDEAVSSEDDPFVTMSRKQAVLAVERGIAELPLSLREIVVLCELEEMSYQDAAEALGVPVGTVRSRLHRAKRRLALLLKEDDL